MVAVLENKLDTDASGKTPSGARPRREQKAWPRITSWRVAMPTRVRTTRVGQ